MVIGHRDASGWHYDKQVSVPGSLNPDTAYQVLVAVNGTVVTVTIGSTSATFTFAPRMIDGQAVGLNKGLVGVGSDNSRGTFDNLYVQTTPPNMTLDSLEDFNDGAAQQFTGAASGTWSVANGRDTSTAAANTTSVSLQNLGKQIDPSSYEEIQATLNTNGIGAVAFDGYATNDFKFAALDVPGKRVLIGHVAPGRGWIVDASAAFALTPGVDYAVVIVLTGTTVSVTVNGAFALSFAFNSPVVDGAAGIVSRGGTTSFDSFKLRTNDSAFSASNVSAADTSSLEGASGTTNVVVTFSLSTAATSATSVAWSTADGTATAATDYVAASGIVTFAAGATSAQITLRLRGDTLSEADETFYVVLSGAVGLSLARNSAAITIRNDDTAALSVANTSVVEGNSGTKTVNVTVTLAGSSASTVTVGYSTVAGSALAGTDFVSTSGTLTFAPGVTSKTITVTINGNTIKQGNRTFTVVLSSPVNATVASGTATVTIIDDELALTAAYAPTSAQPVRSLTSADLTSAVTRAKASWLAVVPGADFSGVTFEIGDLDGLLLGITSGRSVTIDATAAGWGWGAGGIDLLTVVSHELGHILGLDHEEDGLMADTLAPGQMKVPGWITALKPDRIGAQKRTTIRAHVRAPHGRATASR
jgi:hypothetical protein